MLNSTTEGPSFWANKLGTHVFTLIVRDDNDTWSDPDEVRITVVPKGSNLPPNADAGDDAEYVQGEEVHLQGSGYDLDGAIEAWEWTSPPEIALNGSDTDAPHFTADLPGTWDFSLRVRDDEGSWSEPDGVTITVVPVHVNLPPVAVAGDDQVVEEGMEAVLDGSGSYDPDGNITEYLWDCLDRNITLAPSASIAVLLEPGSYTFSLVVEDDEGARSAPDLVELTVEEKVTPPPPVLNVTPTIGPLLTDLGNAVAGATVRLTWGDLTFIGVTDGSGSVKFTRGIPPGNYTMNVTMDGSGLIPDILVWVKADGTVSYSGGALPRVVEEKEPIDVTGDRTFLERWGLIMAAALAAIVLAVIASIVVLVVRSRSGAESEGDTSMTCPDCGERMELKEEFGTYFCKGCGGSE
jgi:hypothetical protein